MKTSQTFFYNEENGNIQYLDKRGFIGELCIVISKKDKNILCLDEIKKIYNLSYKDIVKKFEKVFKKLDTNIYGLKVQSKLGLICLIDKSTEDFEKYCKKNKLKFGQEVSNINKKNLFTKEGKCDIINYKPKESKEELKKMNKKLIKRVAVASLAALMTIPSLTTTSYALEVERNANGTAKSVSGTIEEVLEFNIGEITTNAHLYSDISLKSRAESIIRNKKATSEQIKIAEKVLQSVEQRAATQKAAKQAQQAAVEAQKAAEEAAIAEAHAMYGTHSFHGEAEVNAYLQQFKRHGSEKWDTSPLASSQKTVKQEIDSKFTNPGSTCYTKFMNKYGENPYFKGEEDIVRNMDFTLSFGETIYGGLPIIKDRAPHITMELMETRKTQGNAGIGNPLDIEDAIVKITYYSPIDGYVNIGGLIRGSGTVLDVSSPWGNGKYVWGMGDNDKFTAAQSAARGEYYVCKGKNEFCMEARIHTYIAGTTTPAPGLEEKNYNYITQEMLNNTVQGLFNRDQAFLFSLRPACLWEEYIDD